MPGTDEVDHSMTNQAGRHPTAWRFADLFDVDHIQRLQDAFADLHRVSAVITDPGGAPITRVSRRADLRRLAGEGGSRPPAAGAAVLDRDWSGAAPITVERTPLAEWRINPTPGMTPGDFARVCGFLEQAAELVSHQARMQVELNEARQARRLAEEHGRQLRRQLRQSMGMVTVGRLAGGVAHDFGNLLTAITAYAEDLVEAEDDPGDPGTPAARILAAAERAAGLVHRLLDVARQETARGGEVDVVDIIGEIVALLEKTVPASVRITRTVDGTVRPIDGDAACLHAALLNLGINAGPARRRAGGELIYTVREVGTDRGSCVEVRVRDTGEGMDEETRRRIFDPFFTTRADAGSGLGLTHARHCIEEHGGTITVRSRPGEGTVFTVLLPVSRGARQERRAAG
jgi:signal transduction histidine kinase